MTVGNGSLAYPWTLTLAVQTALIQPGDTVWLRGGVYRYDDLTCVLVGTAESPITVKPYPGEVAVIDAGLDLNGAYTLWDCDYRIVFRWSGWTGRENTEGVDTTGLNSRSFNINGPGIELRHAIILDYDNVGFWAPAEQATLYGCVSGHHGWMGTDRGHGHACYTQNAVPSKLIKHCFFLPGFAWGIHAYGTDGAFDDYLIIQNVAYGAGRLRSPYSPSDNILIGGEGGTADNNLIDGNNTYDSRAGLLSYGGGWTNTVVRNNYMPEGVSLDLDGMSENTNNVTAPPAEGGTHARLYADDYSTERAYLTVYNWDNLNSVSVDVSSVFVPGDTLYLWSVQAGVNEAGVRQDRVAYTVAGDGTIAVDMRASEHPVAAPYQWTAPPTTFPTFGAFVVERDNA